MRHQASFVSAQPPPTVLVDDRAQVITMHSVRAEWAQNCGGGIGAGILVACAWLILHGALYAIGMTVTPWPDAAQVAIAATIVGAIVFGVLMLVRSALDEVVESLDWQRAMSDLEAADAEIAELRTLLTAAEKRADIAENQARVQAANQANHKYVAPAPERAQVWRDCEWLIQRRFDAGTWSRSNVTKLSGVGWTQGQWKATMDKLTLAGLVKLVDGANEPIYDSALLMFEALHEYEAEHPNG